jgi:hypothetical protein
MHTAIAPFQDLRNVFSYHTISLITDKNYVTQSLRVTQENNQSCLVNLQTSLHLSKLLGYQTLINENLLLTGILPYFKDYAI